MEVLRDRGLEILFLSLVVVGTQRVFQIFAYNEVFSDHGVHK